MQFYCLLTLLQKKIKNPQFNFSSQNLSIERNFFKWYGKVTKWWHLLFHRIWKNICIIWTNIQVIFLSLYLLPLYICIYSREELPNDERKLQPKHSQELLDLASKMRMNTDSRKTIFCTLMSSNDYLDAFEKLVKLPLKSPVKEREMAFVLSMCCLKEPQFNPFYAHVSAKLIRQDRKFRMSFQVIVY